jgi:hypothetical protein
MANSSQSTENAQRMLRDLMAVEALVQSLEQTAPKAVAAAGGAQLLVYKFGRPTGAWFWSIMPMLETLWLSMAEESQARHRSNQGEQID